MLNLGAELFSYSESVSAEWMRLKERRGELEVLVGEVVTRSELTDSSSRSPNMDERWTGSWYWKVSGLAKKA